MSNNPLDPSALISSIPNLLPTSEKELKSPQDGIAALLHAAMSALAFRLIAVDDSAPAQSDSNNTLPDDWNKNGPGHYTFRYRHDQSSLEFVMKVAKLGTRTLVNAIAVESDKASSLDISTNDFVSPSFFPHDLAASEAQPLVHGFISSNRITDLLSSFQLQIIQKLIPGLSKDGYTEQSVDDSRSGGSSARPSESVPAPRSEASPYAPEIYQNQPPLNSRFDNPLEIGRRDLDPFPQNPFSPPSLFPQTGGDGMFVGPNHPIFGAGRGGFPSQGPWGADGVLPPNAVPPGARFDPIGPFSGGIGFPGRRGPRGRGGSPGGGNHFGPDNDEFMPPGSGDMYM